MNVINSFPGYEFKYIPGDTKKHNIYRDTDLGKGGYVYANPGIYGNVALLDVNSLHPHSIIAMNYFGEYTKTYKELIQTRLYIKHGELDKAKEMFGGKLAKYLDDPSQAKNLSNAIKLGLNSCYGLTSANFENPMRHPMNENNIVALRGALFMKTLQDEVQARGFHIVAIRTDSIKIADATPEIIEFCMGFAKQYGYTFEHEATYDRMCQVNDADYIAKYKDGPDAGKWTVTGAKFAVPYVFKKLFSREPIEFEDLCEVKEVKTAIYLDKNESLPNVSEYEKELDKLEKQYKEGRISDTTFESEGMRLSKLIEEGHCYTFVGKVGNFCPIKPGHNGGILMRKQGDKYIAVTGTKGYRWLEAEHVKLLEKEDSIDVSYYEKLATEAAEAISLYGDFEWFVSDDPYISPEYDSEGRPIYEEEIPF